MSDTSDGDRHSKALSPDLVTDPDEKAEREARNGLRQFDRVVEMVDYWLQPDRPFRLRPSAILDLQRIALDGISAYVGNYRPSEIEIAKSKHDPPARHRVPELVEDMCDYVNENWNDKSAIHLASYVMWRLNWIHPFTDGNGRTSRALSYLVLCVKLGYLVPGPNTIPEQIASDKEPYYVALEAADKAARDGAIDVGALEDLLSARLATQLHGVYQAAKGAD